jgi:hypothetical protein
MFGKIGSFQEIKDELASFPIDIGYIPKECLSNVVVSNFVVVKISI